MDEVYEKGDKLVFLDKNDVWDGPATVEAVESKTIFVLHNGNLKKVATCRARRWIDDVIEGDEPEDEKDLTSEFDTTVEAEIDIVIGEVESEPDKVPSEDEALEEDEFNESRAQRRPTKGSIIKFRMKNEEKETTGKVVNVGKKNSKEKDKCWLKMKEETLIDFFLEKLSLGNI